MKKILIIPSWYPTSHNPSLGVFFRLQAQLLRNVGNDVKVLLPVVKKQSKKEFIKSGLKKSITINSDYCLQEPEAIFLQFNVNALSKKLDLTKEIVEDLIPDLISMVSKWNWKPDIIHAHDCFPAGFFAQALSKHFKCPWVLTQHTPLVATTLNENSLNGYRFLTANATLFSVVSSYERDLYIRNQFLHDAFVLGNLLDETSFYPADVGSSDNNSFTIINVGSLSARKDYPTLLLSLKIFKERYAHFFKAKLVMLTSFTDGISLEDIKEMVSDMNLTDNIEFVFDISDPDIMRKHYQTSSVMVSTSLYETFGVAVAEAIASGIPVIATDNGGVRDIVDEGVNGFVVPLKNAEAIADKLELLYNSSNNLNKEKLHNSVVSKFGSRAFEIRLNTLYNDAVNLYNN
ncbi:glycosyltransferase [Flavihumibacter sp.]|uniref:glycosyltransferase n=1 Tax=Flavihumibacter sp. TaxID=1913981 RepID=UPI002FC99EB8